MVDQEKLLGRQQALARFGDFVMGCDDLQQILTEACRLVAEALGADLAKVLEIEPRRGSALVRAGIGWNEGVVGKVRIALDESSSEAHAIRTGEPSISHDIATEDRFTFLPFMLDHGVRAIVNVPILLPGRKAFGLLEVDSRIPCAFDQGSIEFLQTYATVLGLAVDRLSKLGQLEQTAAMYRLIVENARDHAIILTDPADRITGWLAGAESVFGWTEEEALGRPIDILFTPEDRAAGVPAGERDEAARDGKSPDIRWHVRKDGSRVFIDGRTTALRNRTGHVTGFMKIGQDVTAQREWDDRQRILLAELQHRTRNLMGVVRTIAEKTARASEDLADFRNRFGDRMEALARVQGLLSRLDDISRVTFDELIRDELEAVDGGVRNAFLDGPAGVALRSSTVQTLAMALHELATNAVKYGALSQPDASLSIVWRLEPPGEDERPWLHIDWRETDVAIAETAPRSVGGGQGRELIERALPYQLGARTTYMLNPDGVHCTIALPVSDRAMASAGNA